jgi:hypothetical protein
MAYATGNEGNERLLTIALNAPKLIPIFSANFYITFRKYHFQKNKIVVFCKLRNQYRIFKYLKLKIFYPLALQGRKEEKHGQVNKSSKVTKMTVPPSMRKNDWLIGGWSVPSLFYFVANNL